MKGTIMKTTYCVKIMSTDEPWKININENLPKPNESQKNFISRFVDMNKGNPIYSNFKAIETAGALEFERNKPSVDQLVRSLQHNKDIEEKISILLNEMSKDGWTLKSLFPTVLYSHLGDRGGSHITHIYLVFEKQIWE